MTEKALTEIIYKSEHKEWLSELTLTFQFDVNKSVKPLKGFNSIFMFFENELNKWKKEDLEVTANQIKNSIDWLKSSSNQLNEILKEIVNDSEEYQLKTLWNSFSRGRANEKKGFYLKDFRETGFLLELHNFNAKWVDSAHSYLMGEFDTYNESSDSFEGRMLAYEFRTKELASLVGRKKQDQEALAKLRGEYETLLSSIRESGDAVQIELEQRNKSHLAYLKNLEESTSKNLKQLDSMFYSESNKLVEATDERFKVHEETYKNLLQLKEPADHWERRAAKLFNHAIWWLVGLIAAVLTGATLVIVLSKSLSSSHIVDQINNPAISIRWSILSLIYLGFIAFLIRVFTKMMMSNFHLYRDAQERKQLTYLYLSLKNEGDVPDTDRHIVLQALFSRVDTGLLKDDSSPTMPITLMDKINAQS